MITGIHHISLKCESKKELDKVKHFYLELLGFSLKREWPDGIMIDAGNCLLEVFSNGPGVKEKGAIRHMAFATDDVDG
nr:VOC family protein [Lachnospiraceae bacterium]